jgi:predicted ATP-dependent serine protease
MRGPARDEIAPLLGRANEQGLLASLLDEARTRGQALVLRGEPGIGKSRLLVEAAREARERGMAVLTANGVQSEAHLPFAALHQLLHRNSLTVGEAERVKLLIDFFTAAAAA